jgi:hypothetical protein
MTLMGKARDNIRVRAEPNFDALETGFIYVTTDVEIIGVEGDWLRVNWEGKPGYVARKFILVTDQDGLATLEAYPTPPSQAAAPRHLDDQDRNDDDEGDAAPAPKPKRPTRVRTSLSAKKKNDGD